MLPGWAQTALAKETLPEGLLATLQAAPAPGWGFLVGEGSSCAVASALPSPPLNPAERGLGLGLNVFVLVPPGLY